MIGAARVDRAGYAVDGVAMLETDTRYTTYSAAERASLLDEWRRRVAAAPGVDAAILARGLPMQTVGVRLVPDRGQGEASPIVATAVWAGPGFFDTLRIPVLYGRGFNARDGAGAPRVAVVSETMARAFFGTADPVGRRVRFERGVTEWIEIVGVVRDTGTADLQGDLVDPTRMLFYRPYAQWNVAPTVLLARTSGSESNLLSAMQRELRTIDPALPVIAVSTMRQYLEQSLTAASTTATALLVLGAIGLALAAIGLYAVVAFGVTRRTREIGIRVALGARSRQVVAVVTRQTASLIGAGTAVGLLLTVVAILAIRAAAAPAPGIALYRPSPQPLAFAAIAAVMVLAGVAAAFVPALRASAIDPLSALRRD
jgi:ABC-type antimicrobial peptide transport system permease subunit